MLRKVFIRMILLGVRMFPLLLYNNKVKIPFFIQESVYKSDYSSNNKIRRNQETMLKIVLIMLCGIGTGYLLRNKKMSFLGRIITALIWVLLFLLGIEVGSNPRIIGGIQTLGLEAVILTIGGSAGSVLFAWALWKYVTAKQMKSSGSADTEKGGKA